MSRLKLVLLVLIIGALGIVFFQNREPLALKLLCPDTSQSCLYQTPSYPLALWIGLFALGGLITSLLGQILNRYRYGGGGRRKSMPDDFEENTNRWSPTGDRSDRYSASEERDIYDSGNYEVPQKPESVELSGSNYSYKYRDASRKSKDVPDSGDIYSDRSGNSRQDSSSKNNRSQKTSLESEIDSNLNQDKDDEDWI